MTHASIDARRDRNLLKPAEPSEHSQGWVLYNSSKPLPDDASAEMRAGYDEGRRNFLSWYTATDEEVLQVKP